MTKSYMRGIHTILTTPLTGDFMLDEAGLARNVEFGATSNAHALVVLGTQGEFPSFSIEERKTAIRITTETAAGRKPVIAGTSDSNTWATVELTQFAQEAGAQGVLVTPPYFSAISWKGVHQHFKTLNDSTDLDIFIYNAPERAGFNVTPPMLAELAELKNINAVKQAGRNIIELEETVSQVGDRMAVFGGSEAMMWPMLSIGMVGSSTTAATFMPQYFVDMYDHAVAGRMTEGRAMYDALAALRVISKKHGHAAVVKKASELVGLAGGPVRPPLTTPSDEDVKDLRGILEKLGIL